MTEAKLRRLVRLWASRLGLDHYKLEVNIVEFDDDTAAADTSTAWHYDSAVIRFQPWLVGQAPKPDSVLNSYDDDEVEVVIVHELVHVALGELDAFPYALDGQVHRDVYSVASRLWNANLERVVDRIARGLVKAWPAR